VLVKKHRANREPCSPDVIDLLFERHLADNRFHKFARGRCRLCLRCWANSADKSYKMRTSFFMASSGFFKESRQGKRIDL
jgi:hypothetical protein